MNKLYIIGNGFDLFHKLKTKMCDFKKYLENNDKTLLDDMEQYFKGDLWSDFEAALGEIDIQEIIDDNVDHIPSEESENNGELHGMADSLFWQTEELFKNLKYGLNGWILGATNGKQMRRLFPLDRNALYLTFNYSNVLETLYSIESSQVLHIHGEALERRPRNEKWCDDEDIVAIVIGHSNQSTPKLKTIPMLHGIQHIALDEGVEVVERLHRKLFKNSKQIIDDKRSFFSALKSIEKVIVIGHSLSTVDQEYFTRVAQSVRSDATWLITYFGEGQYQATHSVAKEIVQREERFTLIDLSIRRNADKLG